MKFWNRNLPKVLFVLLALLLMSPHSGWSQGSLGFEKNLSPNPISVPIFSRYVVDTAHVLSTEDQVSLEQELQMVADKLGSQVAILTLPHLGGEPIESFAHRVFQEWKLGRKKTDDGVLLVMSLKERAIRIEVGRGLEGALSDILTYRIISDLMIPALKDGKYGAALSEGVNGIRAAIAGENLPTPSRSTKNGSASFPTLVFLGIFIGTLFNGLFKGTLGVIATLIVTTIVGVSFLFMPFFLSLVAGVIASFFSAGARGAGWSSRNGSFSIPPFGGGFGGTSGGGPFSGGGFGGGGGGISSGGGASARW
jgi:uncharacterized protein